MIRLPDQVANVMALADWLELSLLVLSEEPFRVSDADIMGALADAGLDHERDRENLSAEINRRLTILGQAYPFFRDGEGFSRLESWIDRLPYSFMLLLSCNQYYAELVYGGAAVTPARLFEFAAGQSLKSYVGGEFVRLGASRVAPVPAGMPAAVAHAAELMREQNTYGQLEQQVGGDDGCDIIAWRAFADRQPGQLIVLGQCAIGTDWREKRSELDLEVWSKHINWHTKPIKAFCVPFVHVFGNSWRETAARGGVVFDRLRIIEHLGAQFEGEHFTNSVQEWCEDRAAQVAALAVE